ncbi:MAG: ABC transporter substrate-binding protein [Eubacteriales bacterium]
MKKLLSLFLACVFVFTLSACSVATTGAVRVGVLSGPTGMGMAKLMGDSAAGTAEDRYAFSLYANPSNLVSDLISGTIDIAALPTNTASALYHSTNGGVQVLAVNTLGVLHILENGNTVNSVQDLVGKTLYISAPGSTTEYILRYVLVQNGIDPDRDLTIESVPDHDTLGTMMIAGQIELCMLPQPKVSVVLMNNSAVRAALDVNAEWEAVAEGSPVQGCLVVRTDFARKNPQTVKRFLAEYKASVDYITDTENLNAAAAAIVAAEILPNVNIAKMALPQSNIVYLDGSEMKSILSGFLAVLLAANPASIGGALPPDEFYYFAE